MKRTKRPSRETLTRYDKRPRTDSQRISPFLRAVHGLLLDQIPFAAWSRVLCLECGNGWSAEEVWRRMGRGYVCGVDISTAMADLARQLRGIEGQLEFQAWDGEHLTFPEGSFDIVVSSFAFHRYVDPLATLCEMRRVLRPGGRTYMLEPDRSGYRGLFALWDYYFRLTDPGHVRYYAPVELLQLLERAGFVEARQLQSYRRVLSGGKLLASAAILGARRDDPQRD